MKQLQKVTAFVVSESTPRQLVVFEHPLAGIQLPAGTVEPGEDILAAARREVFEETGIEVQSRGHVLDEQVRRLGPERAAMLETLERNGATFRRGFKVRVLGEDTASGTCAVRLEIYDHNASPPELLSATDAQVPTDTLAFAIRRTFVLFVEQKSHRERWSRQADGHTFELFWTPLRPDIELAESQREWVSSQLNKIVNFFE